MNSHLHFDPVGGVAGDMFAAAMLDTFPKLLTPCLDDLQASGVLEHVDINLEPGKSQSLAVQRFTVRLKSESVPATSHYKDIVAMLNNSQLDKQVLSRALALFHLLGTAESRVHGVALDDVHFHEVADWDSIADIVVAASLIEHCGVDTWSCSALPVGSGLVNTQHGLLPVPAPATLVLLEGLPSWDDGEPGERVTPTGAAIMSYLLKSHSIDDIASVRPNGRVCTSGMGAGKRFLVNKPNVLRCTLIECDELAATTGQGQTAVALVLAAADFEHHIDHIAQLSFAIDDMSPEELAVALQFIRQSDGVFDVGHQVSFGKKGRMMFDVTVLCDMKLEPVISRQCFTETSTLGLRVQCITRRVLQREQLSVVDKVGEAGVKQVVRPLPLEPLGVVRDQHTVKVESNDIRRIPGLYARRQRARELSAKVIDTDV